MYVFIYVFITINTDILYILLVINTSYLLIKLFRIYIIGKSQIHNNIYYCNIHIYRPNCIITYRETNIHYSITITFNPYHTRKCLIYSIRVNIHYTATRTLS